MKLNGKLGCYVGRHETPLPAKPFSLGHLLEAVKRLLAKS